MNFGKIASLSPPSLSFYKLGLDTANKSFISRGGR